MVVERTISTSKQEVLPHNDEIEKRVLAYALFKRELRTAILDRAKPDLFYSGTRGSIFDAIRQDPSKDPLIIFDEQLTKHGPVGALRSENLAELIELGEAEAPPMETVLSSIERLERLWERREYVLLGKKMIVDAYSGDVNAGDVEGGLFRLQRYRGSQGTSNREAVEEILLSARDGQTEQESVVFGLPNIDKAIGGICRTDYIVLAARPNIGKTPLMLNMALNRAAIIGKHQLIFSLEMTKAQAIRTLASQDTGIPLYKLIHGGCPPEELDALKKSISWITRNITIIDSTIGDIDFGVINHITRKVIKALADRDQELDMAFLDYMQLIGRKKDQDNKRNYIAGVSEGIKDLAKLVRIPFTVVCSTNRDIEKRSIDGGFVRPKMSDLAECGALEFDCMRMLFLCDKSPTSRYIWVAKNRFGNKEFKIPVNFNWRVQKFWEDNDFRYSEESELSEEG